MPGRAGYLFMVAMDVAKDKEALFNEVYDTEHVPHLAKVPGVRGIGEKSAQALLQKYESLDQVYAHLESIAQKRQRNIEWARSSVVESASITATQRAAWVS